MAEPEQKKGLREVELDIPAIREDPELAALALHLQKTQLPMVDPLFRERLQSKLLEIVSESNRQEPKQNKSTLPEDLMSGDPHRMH